MESNVTRLAKLFGGVRAMERKLGLAQSTVAKWNERGGHVPVSHNSRVLAAAKKEGIGLAEIEPFLELICPRCGQRMHSH